MPLLTTNTLLLEGLEDPDNEGVWREFHGRYWPVLVGFASRSGLGEDDARECAQETLVRFVGEFQRGRYDRQRGRLRSWIFAIARMRVLDLRRERARHAGRRGSSVIGDVPDDDEALERAWEAEWGRAILRHGFDELRTQTRFEDQTIHAFELLVLEEKQPVQVADTLGMSVNSVYVAKHRVLDELRSILERLEEEF